MNRSLKFIVATVGIMLGFSGMNHGFFETLQGSTPTPGLIIQAIGPAQRMWEHGTEEALTIIHNFLVTGITAMVVSLAIILWSVNYLHTKHAASVFIFLFVLLVLVGGGIGQIIFFLPAWGFARLINSPLTGWQKALPATFRGFLALLWPYSLTVAAALFLFALEIAIFGYVPGMNDAQQKLYLCWTCLGIAWLVLLFSYAAGIADDIQKQVEGKANILHQ